MNLATNFPHIHQVVIDMAANAYKAAAASPEPDTLLSVWMEGYEPETAESLTPPILQRIEECMESRLMTRGDMVDLDEWLCRLTPEETTRLTTGDPEDALDLLLDSPEAVSGDHVGELLADVFHVI